MTMSTAGYEVTAADLAFRNGLPLQQTWEYYDPASRHRHESTIDFLGWVANTRHLPVIDGLGQMTGHEVILAECVDLDLQDGPGIGLPIYPDRQQKIIEHRHARAAKTAGALLTVADQQIDLLASRQLPILGRRQPVPSRLQMAGMVGAAVAYEGKKRRSGGDTYWHSDEVAITTRSSWHSVLGNKLSEPDEEMLELLTFLDRLHDAPEDTMDNRGEFITKPVIINPLVARKVLEKQENPRAAAAARTLFLLMRTRDVEYKNLRMDYVMEYLHRGMNYGGDESLLYDWVKLPDMVQNLRLDPELPNGNKVHDQKIVDHQAEYEQGIHMITDDLVNMTDLWHGLIAHRMTNMTKPAVRAASYLNYGFNRAAANRAVHDLVLAA